jgi:hypothetical protein
MRQNNTALMLMGVNVYDDHEEFEAKRLLCVYTQKNYYGAKIVSILKLKL